MPASTRQIAGCVPAQTCFESGTRSSHDVFTFPVALHLLQDTEIFPWQPFAPRRPSLCASVAISKTPPDLVLQLLVSTTPASWIGDQVLTCLRLCVVIAHQFPRAGGFSPSSQLRNRYGVSRLTLTRKRGFS